MPTWTLTYQGFNPEEEGLREALCVLGNGYFCTRGAAEWADADENIHYPGTYVAGGYNRLTTEIVGRPIENEDLVNLPNWLCLTFRIEGGDWLDLAKVEVLSYRQELNVREGVLVRTLRVRDGEGRETTINSRRIVSMAKPHLAAIEMTITPKNWSGPVEIRSALDGRVINSGVARYRQLASDHLLRQDAGIGEDGNSYVLVETVQSGLKVAEAARTRFFDDAGQPVEAAVENTIQEGYVAQTYSVEAAEGKAIRVEKTIALYTSRDRAISHPLIEAVNAVGFACGFADLLRGHAVAWKQLWRRCDVVLDQRQRVQMILRVHIFHLLQTASRNTVDLDVGIPARGWHGEAYRGHIFWDELFIFPFLNYNIPELTHSLLRYRYRRLDEARTGALEAGYKGAMFPWQSGTNGREETQSVHLNPKSGRWLPDLSRNQRHVNIAISYNVWQYWQATGNDGFMSIFGAELLFEICRFWASIAHFNADQDRYEIHGVMGPDEYHEEYPDSDEVGLRNNAYTNVMVAWCMDTACKVVDSLLPYRREELCETLELTDGEISIWAEMSRKLYVPFHDDGIISQFEGYGDLKEFDWEGYRKKYGNIARLDRILEAEGDSPNNYKLSKQADVLMLFYLFSEDELARILDHLGYKLDPADIRRNIDYYSARTSHGSTLSTLVQSAVTSRYDRDTSWKTFCEALESDISDVQGGTTAEGIHLGAMAGTVDLVQRVYTGLEIREGVLFFNPRLPTQLESIKFAIRYRGMRIDVHVTSHQLSISPRADKRTEPVKIGVGNRIHFVKPGYERVFDLEDGA
ncbi:MAG: glycoside hydrolase family 65 protein [Rhodospirillales bacterium]|jgi:alpha,alpha-trehalase|nr:glycoside hydrolase family 65 protein [Rhodospirillales bacterium]